MRKTYPKYSKKGDLKLIKGNLSKKNKQELENFSTYLLTTNKQAKVDKILRLLIQFYDVTEIDLFQKPTREERDSFLALLNNSHYKKSYKREVKVYVKKFLKWKWKDLELLDDFPKLEKNEPDWNRVNEGNLLTKKDVENLIIGERSIMWKCYISLIYETGCRPEEALNLTWKKIQFFDNNADILIYSKKTGKSRTYPIVNLKWLKEWKGICNSPFVFPSPQNETKPIGVPGANFHLKNLGKRIGLNKDIYNYLFRFSRATELYDSMPIKAVEQLLGHSGMYKIYQQMSNKKAREMLLNKLQDNELTISDRERFEKRIVDLEQSMKHVKNGMEEIIKKIMLRLNEKAR